MNIEHLLTDVHIHTGWRLTWLMPRADAMATPTFVRDFSRVVIGVCLDDQPHAVVLGERRLFFARESAYYYLVLDEAIAPLAYSLFEKLIALKDRYRVKAIYCPKEPVLLAQDLRQQEGLTHYQTQNEQTAATIWPTFVSFETKAGITLIDPPEEQALHRTLEEHLAAVVVNPDLGTPVESMDHQPVYRLGLPADMPNQQTASGLRQALVGPCMAVYVALHTLWNTRDLKGRELRGPKREPKPKGNPYTGY